MKYPKIIADLEIGDFLIVSIAYIISYTLVGGFIYPLQIILVPEFPAEISLLFLPHGVRMLTVHHFGWRSIPLLLPASYLMWFISVFGFNIPMHPFGPVASIAACGLGYGLMTLMFRTGSFRINREWQFLIAAGALGSFFNGVSNSFLNGTAQLTTDTFYYMIGDVSGQIVLMLVGIYVLKFIRNLEGRAQ